MRPSFRWLLLVLLTVGVFYWKIVFTRQFSVLLDYEGANQAYAWYHFSAASLQQGVIPLWDPYTHSGRSFVGEMQTGLFYPPKLLLYFWPLNRSHLFSPQLFHYFFVLTHVLGAWFLFLLARELGLEGFPALVAALCFSLGGFVGRVGWPNMLDSAIWLPVTLLFLLRAIRAESVERRLLYACAAGLAMGMSILAGSLHVAMMQALVVAGAGAFFGLQAGGRGWKRFWPAALLITAGTVAFLAAAVQLLPSMEYSQRALRFLGDSPPRMATHKILYAQLKDNFWPRALLGFLLGSPFPGGSIGTGEVSPYFGVLPLLLAVLGTWRNWVNPAVRFLTGLAALAFFYSLGEFSLLHGVLYVLVPYLWMAREAGRFLYCAHFAMALLAGFGARSLFSPDTAARESLGRLERGLRWLVLAMAVLLGLPALYGKPDVNEWSYFSFLLLLATYGLLAYIQRGHRTRAVQLLLVAVILSDLSAFNWTVRNKAEEQRANRDHLSVLLDSGKLAAFLRSQPGSFRTHFQADWEPNIGDLYGVETTGGKSASMLKDYADFLAIGPKALDLLNVRYMVRPATAGEPGPVYQDARWKAYENPGHCPRAWVVYKVVQEPSRESTLRRLAEPGLDPLHTAVVEEPLEAPLDARVPESNATVTVNLYEPGRMEVTARSPARGLLVLSEVDYPGWKATVNGEPALVHKVNGLLRGVLIPEGESRVMFRYAPGSVWAGAWITLLTFSGALAWAAAFLARERMHWLSRSMRPAPHASAVSLQGTIV